MNRVYLIFKTDEDQQQKDYAYVECFFFFASYRFFSSQFSFSFLSANFFPSFLNGFVSTVVFFCFIYLHFGRFIYISIRLSVNARVSVRACAITWRIPKINALNWFIVVASKWRPTKKNDRVRDISSQIRKHINCIPNSRPYHVKSKEKHFFSHSKLMKKKNPIHKCNGCAK